MSFEQIATVSCAVLLPPYSRAAATACFQATDIAAAHRLPVHEACGYCRGRFRPLLRYVNPPKQARCGLFAFFQDAHSRPPVHSLFDHKLCLKNLFQQIALVHARWRAHAQAFAFLHQHDLIGVLACQI